MMTGRDVLMQQLAERGASATQLKSKLIDLMLEVLAANSDDMNLRAAADSLKQEREAAEKARIQYEELVWEYKNKLWNFRSETHEERMKMERTTADAMAEKEKTHEEYEKYVQMRAELMRMETPEGRDIIRKACWFRENTSIDTKYDNTAFISGLGAILAGTTKKEEDEK